MGGIEEKIKTNIFGLDLDPDLNNNNSGFIALVRGVVFSMCRSKQYFRKEELKMA
jgi:hypothetical protein